MKIINYIILSLLCLSCISNNDKCIQKLFNEVGVEKDQIHKATHLVTILGKGCEKCLNNALAGIKNSTDTIYIIACQSNKTFKLISNLDANNYSNVYLDTKLISVELGMTINTPIIYTLKDGKYISHSFYGKEITSNHEINTSISSNIDEIDLGEFKHEKIQKIKFMIRNTGSKKLKIENIDLSCECLKLEKDLSEIPIGNTDSLNLIFHADSIGAFQREILLFGNFNPSPKLLTVKGVCN